MNAYPGHAPGCVMITGATGDLGRAFAQRFAALGCKLIVHGRSADKVKTLVEALPGDVYGAVFDLEDTAAIAAGIAAIPDHFRDIDVLVNNAGLGLGLDKAHEASLADWDRMIDIDIRALAHVTRHVLPLMVAAKRGHVINIGSIAANWVYAGGNVYSGAKGFVQRFSLAVRADLEGTNIRVSCIEPGMVETQFSKVRFKGDEARASAVYANTRPLKAEDIAEAVVWCATLPAHVNINTMEIMPTTQHPQGAAVERSA